MYQHCGPQILYEDGCVGYISCIVEECERVQFKCMCADQFSK